jgi:cyclic lactone autoinducer peptide
MKNNDNKLIAKVLTSVTNRMLSIAANSRCVSVYHQPKQPDAVKKFRKF